MANSVDPDQLASSEANWSGSTQFAKTGHVVFSKKKGLNLTACLPCLIQTPFWVPKKFWQLKKKKKQIFWDILEEFSDFFFHAKICCLYSFELPHRGYSTFLRGNSNEYTQNRIILQKIYKTSLNNTHLPPDLALLLGLSGSNYLCLEPISMVQKIFEPQKCEYIQIPNKLFIYLKI